MRHGLKTFLNIKYISDFVETIEMNAQAPIIKFPSFAKRVRLDWYPSVREHS